mmetsp:Transcript_52046/g.122148  ORF Transcript_52046/g.122148 Transcript_52046/m.122148 type:complete len:208 (+) Transcript_52046:594-1217(+)
MGDQDRWKVLPKRGHIPGLVRPSVSRPTSHTVFRGRVQGGQRRQAHRGGVRLQDTVASAVEHLLSLHGLACWAWDPACDGAHGGSGDPGVIPALSLRDGHTDGWQRFWHDQCARHLVQKTLRRQQLALVVCRQPSRYAAPSWSWGWRMSVGNSNRWAIMSVRKDSWRFVHPQAREPTSAKKHGRILHRARSRRSQGGGSRVHNARIA